MFEEHWILLLDTLFGYEERHFCIKEKTTFSFYFGANSFLGNEKMVFITITFKFSQTINKKKNHDTKNKRMF